MVELGIMMALVGTSFVLAFISSQINDENSVIRIFFTGSSMAFLLGAPLTAREFALSAGYEDIASYLVGFQTAITFIFVFFIGYISWLYIRDTSKMMYSQQNQFGDDEI